MNRRTALAALGGGTVTALAGPLSTATAQSSPAAESSPDRTVRVTGTGSVETDPDKAVVTVAVEATDRDDASAVVSELATDSESLRNALLEYGISEDDITTERYSLRHDDRGNRYEGEHRFRVAVNDPDAAGEIVDRSIDAGADSVGHIEFTISEDRRKDLYDDAVDRAVVDAQQEADLYTDAAGGTRGEPIRIETTQTGHRPFRQEVDMTAEAAVEDSAATRIEQGDVAVTAEVDIVYGFQPGR
jgi:Uncharacterized conserved protein